MYRIMQDGMAVASCDTKADAIHYALMYADDGPLDLQSKETGRWVTIMSFAQLKEFDGDDE